MGYPVQYCRVACQHTKRGKEEIAGAEVGAQLHLTFSVIASCSDLLQEQLYFCLLHLEEYQGS